MILIVCCTCGLPKGEEFYHQRKRTGKDYLDECSGCALARKRNRSNVRRDKRNRNEWR